MITANDIINSGLQISSDITEAEITFAIKTVQNHFLLDRYGVKEMTHEDFMVGFCHLVFAYMLYDKIRLTRFSSVIKNDEHSTDPTTTELLEISRMHWEIGQSELDRCAKCLQIEINKTSNNLIFNELVH